MLRDEAAAGGSMAKCGQWKPPRHEEDLHLSLGTAREEAAATVYRLIAAQVEVLQTDSQLEGLQRLKELISSLSGIPGPGPGTDHEAQGHPKARK